MFSIFSKKEGFLLFNKEKNTFLNIFFYQKRWKKEGKIVLIQNCGCKTTFKSSFAKLVGADLKDFRGIKVLYQKSVGAVAPAAPTLTQLLPNIDIIKFATFSDF